MTTRSLRSHGFSHSSRSKQLTVAFTGTITPLIATLVVAAVSSSRA
jgi:hypothetical protein